MGIFLAPALFDKEKKSLVKKKVVVKFFVVNILKR